MWMRKQTMLQVSGGACAALLIEDDTALKRSASVGAVAALLVSGWFATMEFVIPEPIFETATAQNDSKISMSVEREKTKPKTRDKVEEQHSKRPAGGAQSASVKPKGNPRVPPAVALIHQITARTANVNANAYDLLGAQFVRDMQRTLENTNVLRTNGHARFGDRRGVVHGSIDGSQLEGDGTGLANVLPNLLPRGGAMIATHAKTSIPVPKMNEISVGGDASGRSVSEIMAVVRARTPGLRYVYNKYLKTNPGMQGKVSLRFTISPEGSVIDMNIVSSTTGVTAFDEEVASSVRRWTWKAIRFGNTTVTIPFTFSE